MTAMNSPSPLTFQSLSNALHNGRAKCWTDLVSKYLPLPWHVVAERLILITGIGLERYTVLLPRQWTPTRLREPFYSRWNRQGDSQSQNSTERMGEDDIQAKEEGYEDSAEVRSHYGTQMLSGVI